MLDIKKIKYSFVLCLALLFSISFADISVNDYDYPAPNISNNYSMTYPTNYFLIVSANLPNSSRNSYLTYFFNDISSVSKLGIYPGNNGYFLYLLDENNRQTSILGKYVIIPYSETNIELYDSNGYQTLLTSDFPLSLTNTNLTTLQSGFLYTRDNFDFTYCPFDVYEITSFNNYVATLGTQLYYSDGSPSVRPTFSRFISPFTQQETNDVALNLLTNSDITSQLPSDYTHYFIISDSNGDNLTAYFFPSSIIPYGYIFDTKTGYIYYTVHFNNDEGKYKGKEFYIYSFYPTDTDFSLGDPSWQLLNISSSLDFSSYNFDYNNNPVIYTNVLFPFYGVIDGMVSNYPDFTLLPFDIVNNQNQVVTPSDVLDSPRTTTNIWDMLYNIFNPNSSNTGVMNDLEESHNNIISNARYDFFSNFWNSSKYLLNGLTSISWLSQASQALFEPFSSFLTLCCIFITIGRFIR